MCFAAIVEQDLARLKRDFKAKPDLHEFKKLFERRAQGASILIPKAMEENFLRPGSVETAEIAELIHAWQERRAVYLKQDMEQQQKRQAKAEHQLRGEVTAASLQSLLPPSPAALARQQWKIKKLQNEARIAANWIKTRGGQLEDLRRRRPERLDARVYPSLYAPVIAVENGERIIRPMRYLLRLPGRPAEDDQKFSGCYNARRDNLERFWKGQFGHTHGIFVVTSFFENVSRHKMEHRELADGEKEENIGLQFDPKDGIRMNVGCLYSYWEDPTGAAPDLYSFAAVTDEPPAEIAEAGHDRCIVPVSDANLDAWLSPEGLSSDALHGILEQRERPYYEYRVAA